jgi:hypothetical protein
MDDDNYDKPWVARALIAISVAAPFLLLAWVLFEQFRVGLGLLGAVWATIYSSVYMVIPALRRGSIPTRSSVVSRSDRPVGFWLLICFHLSSAALCGLGALALGTFVLQRYF